MKEKKIGKFNLIKIINFYSVKDTVKKMKRGWERSLMPVNPALWEAEVGRSPEFRSSRPTWPTWQNPISTKNTRLAGRGGRHL